VQDRDPCDEGGQADDASPGGSSRSRASEPQESRNQRLSAWFAHWRRPIRHWLSTRSSVPAADVDDLAQEVFLRLLRYGDATVDNPQGYLFRIAANVANEWRERARHRQPHDPAWLDELPMEPRDEPHIIAARRSALEHVRAVVQTLPARQRQVLLLHVNEGLTYKQIAERMRITYRVVLRDLTRAYSQLRLRLTLEDLHEIDRNR
jgi:RNA polymerase sigma-70 factor (ECF subfamily)